MDEIDARFGPTAITAQGVNIAAAGQFIRDVTSEYGRDAPEYAYFLTWLAEDYADVGIRTRGETPGADTLREILEEENGSITPNMDDHPVEVEDIRFGAFFALCRLYEFRGELDQATDLLQEYAQTYDDHPLYHVLQSEIIARQGGDRNLNQAIEDAFIALSQNEGQIEVLHNLAAVIALALEQDHLYTGDRAEIPDDPEPLLRLAARSVERAIGIDGDYAKCYATNAKIRALQGDFTGAKQMIWTAIGRVNRDRPDPARRITEFQQELSNIDLIQQRAEFDTRTEEMMDELRQDIEQTADDYQIRVIQFLGFFAGFLAVTVTIVTVPNAASSFNDAARLILTITGGLLAVFGGFSFVLPRSNLSRTILVVLVGVLLVVLGFLLGPFM